MTARFVELYCFFNSTISSNFDLPTKVTLAKQLQTTNNKIYLGHGLDPFFQWFKLWRYFSKCKARLSYQRIIVVITSKSEMPKDIRKIAITRVRAVFIRVSKSDWFCITALHEWFKKLASLFRPIRSKTKPKTNRDLLAHFFPRFASATHFNVKFWLVHCIVCVLCNWLELLLWFWFYDNQLKTALKPNLNSIVLLKLN